MPPRHLRIMPSQGGIPMPQLSVSEKNALIRELTEIESELQRNIDTTMWISDLHGAGDRFVSILKGRFGLVWRSAYEALPKTFSTDKLEYLDRIIRKEQFFPSQDFAMEKQDVISSLITIIRYKVQDMQDFEKVRGNINEDLKTVLENMILNFHVPNIAYENELIADKVIQNLSRIVKQVILSRLIVLGDVFDRGDEPDKIMRILMDRQMRTFVTFVWGNHDILWMGATVGEPSMVAQALRVTVRYEHIELLRRLGIDISRLSEFANRVYSNEITGNFKAAGATNRRMEKALAVIQFKLEEPVINTYPHFQMHHRMNLKGLAERLKSGDTEGLNDTDFPTLDIENPWSLTEEEKEIIDDLTHQFMTNRRLRRIMEFLYREGHLYHINNYILNLHALIPSTADGRFDEFDGHSGKALLNYFEDVVKRVGERYLAGLEQEHYDLSLIFYLWCGPKSPLFGKDSMKTFERYFFTDQSTHSEKVLHWGENIRKSEFLDLITEEFGVQRIVYGHTPVDVSKGERIASPDGRAIDIDGGFSHAYLARGHSLIHTPYSLYAIILPTEEEMAEARRKSEPARLMFEQIDTFETPLKISDTYRGQLLSNRRQELMERIATEQ